MSVNEKMTAIADAIRDKTNDNEKLTLDDMANSIGEVYNAGRQAEWSAFWDTLQKNGERTDYVNAFYSDGWTDINFVPKYDMYCSRAQDMFTNSEVTDLKGILEQQGVVLDTSDSITTLRMFQYCYNVTRIGVIDVSKSADCRNMFRRCYALQSIDKVVFSESTGASYPFGGMFESCTTLTELTVEGVICQSITFQWSPLSVESMKSIISHLAHYEQTEKMFDYTLTFSEESWERLNAAETPPNGETWQEYVMGCHGFDCQ